MWAMRMYADHRPRRVRQICADVFFVVWIFFWIWQGWSTYHSTTELTEPTERTESAATRLGENMREASDALVELPLVGEAAAAPFTKAAESADELAAAAIAGTDDVRALAIKSGLALALGPTAILAGFYLPLRRRFIHESTEAERYMEVSQDLDLFAFRGMASQPMDVLVRLNPDPVGAWRARDPDFIKRLAGMEIHRRGLTPPFPRP